MHLYRESSKLELLPLVSHIRSRLNTSHDILTDALPSHVVSALLHDSHVEPQSKVPKALGDETKLAKLSQQPKQRFSAGLEYEMGEKIYGESQHFDLGKADSGHLKLLSGGGEGLEDTQDSSCGGLFKLLLQGMESFSGGDRSQMNSVSPRQTLPDSAEITRGELQ